MVVLNAVWKFACMSVLSLQVYLCHKHYNNRPLSHVSLTNMVNHDLLLSYFVFVCLLCVCSIPATMSVRYPSFVAFPLIALFRASINVLFLYFTVSAVVKFLHVHYQRTSLTDEYTDAELIQFIRSFVGSVCLLVQGLRLALDKPSGLFNLLTKIDTGSIGVKSYFGVAAMITLSLTAVATNVLLRYKMSRSQPALLPPGANLASVSQGRRLSMIKYFALATFLLCTSCSWAARYTLAKSEEDWGVIAEGTLAELCLVFPAMGIMLNPKLRKFAVREVKKYVS